MKKSADKNKYGPPIDLRAIEEEALAEGREWTRRRIAEKLREKAAAFSPDSGTTASEGPTPYADA